jgi:tRNA modification GTPase
MIEYDTIVAPATLKGHSALGIIRLSGKNAIEIADRAFQSSNGKLCEKQANTASYGTFVDDNKVIDECIFTIFRSPASYTGEDMVEISHHGSPFVQQQIVLSLIDFGAKAATEGEFTKRAFLNGKMNLSQAEAVADIIVADSRIAHDLALKQLRGGYNEKLQSLRNELLSLCSLLELELDFSEEDVTFANRLQIQTALTSLKEQIGELLNTFALGNAFKEGLSVAIAGKPNAGKSTLLNTLLNDNRSIVSKTAGTTRDTIEEVITIKGFDFRLIDTAGIRTKKNKRIIKSIEQEGIKRSYKAIADAQIVLYVFDICNTKSNELFENIAELEEDIDMKNKLLILVGNKSDKSKYDNSFDTVIAISAFKNENIEEITDKMVKYAEKANIENRIVVTNARHYQILQDAFMSLLRAENSFDNQMPADLIASDIRILLHHIGEITGEVSTEDILGSIFSKFCIGK